MYKEQKYYFPWQVKKEIKYLDSMARKGYIFKEKKLLSYIFEKGSKEMRYHAIAIQLEQKNTIPYKNMNYITGFASTQYYYTTNIKKRSIQQKEYSKLFIKYIPEHSFFKHIVISGG